jgi:arabinogalactan oligomer / maltooligosaccharide transport system permease protein
VRSRAWVAWSFMIPTILVMAVIVFIPLFQSVAYSFTDLTNRNQGTIFKPPSWQFIGLDNYAGILLGSDPNFYPTLIWTVIWTIVNVFFHFTFGLILALALNQRFRGRTLYRLLLLLPWAVPAYITAISWRFLFNGEYGLLNALLGMAGIDRVAWLSEFPWYYIAPIVVNVWLGVPFMMVALLGGLQSIPSELYEAAQVDGASRWQRFWNITIPQLSSVSATVILLGTIWTFNIFVVIFLVTGGGPGGRTDILVTYTYNAFTRGDYANAAAYAVIVFVLLLSFSAVYRRFTREG